MDDKCVQCPHHSGLEQHIRALEDKMHMIVTAQEKALEVAKREVDRRLEGMNNFQHRIDRLENTFATKIELRALQNLVYIGVGIFTALQLFFRFVMK